MPRVTCFGSGKGGPGDRQYDAMRDVGRLLAGHHITVVTGGYGGSGMEAPLLGAVDAGGNTVGCVMEGIPKEPNPHAKETVVVMGGHFTQEMQYSIRLGHLLQSDGFVVDPTDETPGTLIEFFSVVNLNMKQIWQDAPRPVVVLEYWQAGLPKPLPSMISDYARIIGASLPWLHVTPEPEAAVNWLVAHFPASITR